MEIESSNVILIRTHFNDTSFQHLKSRPWHALSDNDITRIQGQEAGLFQQLIKLVVGQILEEQYATANIVDVFDRNGSSTRGCTVCLYRSLSLWT